MPGIRQTGRHRIGFQSAGLLAACLLAGFPNAARAASGPAPTSVLTLATDQSPVGLDPHVATAFSTQLINSNIYEGLTAVDASLRIVPALAQSWTISDDGRTYTFRLRDGATFGDGAKLTPADVVASFARVRDPKTGSPYASRLAAVVDVAAEGSDAVRVTLKDPTAPFLAQLASIAIVPAAAGADLARKPDGTGPFRLTQWIPDTALVLERNPAYWDAGLPKLGGLRFDIVPESATRQLGIASGSYGMLPNIDAGTALSLAGNPDVAVLQAPDLAYSLIGLNASKPPFDKPEVRRAFNEAVDRAAIIAAAYFGKGSPAGPLSPALTQWALPVADFPCYRTDPAAAKALLQKAGVTLPLAVTINVLGSVQQVVDIAQVVQAEANAAGFAVTLNVQEQGRFIQDWRAGNFTAFASLNGGGVDPDDYLGRTFQTGGATNVYHYSDPALDKLLIAARASTDMAARKRMYDEAQRMLACDGPVVHLVYGTLFTATRRTVQGYQVNPTRSLRALRDVAIGP